MRNGNFSYHITGFIRSVYDIGEIYNSNITNEELKPKSLIKHTKMASLYFIQHFYMK